MDTTQRIQIIVENLVKGQEKIDAMTIGYRRMGNQFTNISRSMVAQAMKQQKALEITTKKQQFLSYWSKELGDNGSRMSQIMAKANLAFDESGKVVDVAGGEVGNLRARMKLAEVQTRRFQMSLLSTMFAGMALQRTFTNLLRPAAEAEGIFETWNDILAETFAPIMEALSPILEWFSDLMDNMSNSGKMAIGIFALFGLVLASGLFIYSQAMLAWNGMQIQLLTLYYTSQLASQGVTTLGASTVAAGTAGQVALAPFLPILYAIAGIVAVILLSMGDFEDTIGNLGDVADSLGNAFEKVKDNIWTILGVMFPLIAVIKNFGVIVRMITTSAALFWGWLGDKVSGFGETFKGVFTDIWDFLVGLWDSITTWLEDTWENIKTFATDTWNSIVNFFKDVWNGTVGWFWNNVLVPIYNFFVSIWNTIKDFFWNNILVPIGNFFKNIWTSISTWFSEALTNIGNFFREKWETLKTWFSTTLNNIWNFFKNIWTTIKNWFSDHLNNVVNFFKGIWNSIHDWFSDKLNKIKTFFSDIWNSIKDTAVIVWEGIKNTIKGAINDIIGLINKLIDAWNSLSFNVPSITLAGKKFGGFNVGVPQIPKIPTLAEGGIITRPTLAMLGERGPEKVTPLNKAETVINFSPTYNITVSDKADFERMIKFNNTKLVEDLRRTINI